MAHPALGLAARSHRMGRTAHYEFIDAPFCRMCRAPLDHQRVIGKRSDRPQVRHPRRSAGVAVSVKRCRECGLVYADPMPRPLDLQDHYGVPPESYWVPSYFEVRDDHYAGHIANLRRLLNGTSGRKVLDAGAGIGKAMVALERAGFEAHGFEPSRPFHERAISRMGISPERLRLASVEEAGYAPQEFDAIFFSVVLEHLQDPDAALTKALEWLRPGGLLSVEVPSADWLVNRLVNLYYRLRGTDYVANLSPMHEPYHLYEFTLRSFEAFARRSGAEVVFHEHYVCDTFLPKWLDSILRPLMKWTRTGMEIHVWMRKR